MTLTKPAVETAQDAFELEQLLGIVSELAPERILEVGVWHGGTLWHWLQGGRTVVAVDDLQAGNAAEADQWGDWAHEAGSTLELLQGGSRSPAIVAAAERLGPYDFLFIDAGHEYQCVSADWANYGPMVNPGGIVAFHDIAPRPGYGVSDLWAELKPGARTVEIWAGREAYCGIGVLFV